jgi:hypothetical protein
VSLGSKKNKNILFQLFSDYFVLGLFNDTFSPTDDYDEGTIRKEGGVSCSFTIVFSDLSGRITKNISQGNKIS